jgi:hypothetical protein
MSKLIHFSIKQGQKANIHVHERGGNKFIAIEIDGKITDFAQIHIPDNYEAAGEVIFDDPSRSMRLDRYSEEPFFGTDIEFSNRMEVPEFHGINIEFSARRAIPELNRPEKLYTVKKHVNLLPLKEKKFKLGLTHDIKLKNTLSKTTGLGKIK